MKNKNITKAAVMQVLRDYWQQYRKYPVITFIAFLLPAIGSIFVFFVPPLIIARLVNILAEHKDITLGGVGTYVALFGGLWLIGEILWRIGIEFMIKLDARGLNNLGKTAFERLSSRDYDFYANNFVGSLTKMALAYSRGFDQLTDTFSYNVINNILPILFAFIVLWRYSFWLPVILFAFIVFATLIAIPIIQRRSKLVALRHEASSRVSGRFSDSLTNILAVKSFASERMEQRYFDKNVDEYTDRYRDAANYQNRFFHSVMSPVFVISNTIGLIAAVMLTHTLGLSAGVMVIVYTYYSRITMIFWEISRIYREIESSISEAAEFTQLLIDPPKIQDKPGATELRVTDSVIKFDDVSFKYAGQGKEGELFLSGFNLTIPKNQKVGLVGPSGGGKTTITKLILRFLDVQSGRVMIDEQDISGVTQHSLRQTIAYVPQEPLLFHRSLFDNIAYGSDGATKDDVIHAAKLAFAHDFIMSLPLGYDTMVGERGVKLSGGQRQRVAIARAILKKSSILVLDEATSSLDSESEKFIQKGLLELMKDKTALVIAHRLSTIRHLDRIIVLDQGRILEDGTHDELIEKGGLYAKLWSHQSGDFLEV